MRIGIVSDTYTPQVNGVTTIVRRIVAALAQAGHEVGVVAPRYPAAERAHDPRELRIRSLPFPPYPAIRLSWPDGPAMARFFDAREPEVVHVHTEGPLGVVARAYALRHGIPLVTSYHTDFPSYARHYGAGVLEPLVWRWLSWFHGPADVTLTPGEGTRAELALRFDHARVWGRGVNAQDFHLSHRNAGWRRWLGGADDTVVVLHVGRLAPEKNLDVLIDAWRVARERLGMRATFVVAGEGPVKARLMTHLPFVRWLGFLPRAKLATLYASADLCVLPSHTETCGLVALEAMASGIPVIAADAGGLRESVQHDQSGLLLPPNDAAAFASGIERLVSDAAYRFRLAARAREVAIERDSAREDAELLDIYARLCQANKGVTTACAA